MAFQLARTSRGNLQIGLTDQDRASGLWQYLLKPAAHAVGAVTAAAHGAWMAWTASDAPEASVTLPIPDHPGPEQKAILDRISEFDWYHTIELRHGIRTPGRFNHLPLLADYALPDRLDGKRCLDVATMDGFWAFEMERRGAREVLALDVSCLGDLDVPPRQRATLSEAELTAARGGSFRAAKEILDSKVERVALNVYDLSPERLGKFDFVMVGDLLLHLLNPLKAATNVCSVTSGVAHVVDCFSPYLPKLTMTYQSADQGTWWGFSLSALQRMLWDAGFEKVELKHKFRAPSQRGERPWMWRAVLDCQPPAR